MKKFVTILAVLSAVLFQSCTAAESVEEALHNAEMNMEKHPEQALEILESISQPDLTTRKTRARYALLLSMALDKNYVDIANDSIIAPAVKYYKNHGNADNRLKTLYYWGRIAMNAGEYEDAISRFTMAEPYVESAHDKIAIARLYKAQMLIYQYSYDSDMIIRSAEETARYYLMAGDTTKYINTLNDVVTGYLHKQDTLNTRLRLDELKSYWNSLTPRQMSNWYSAMLLLNEFTGCVDAEEMISEYLSTISEPSIVRWLSVANAYYYSGNLKKASEALEKAEQHENRYFLYYHLISGHINADMGNYHRAADSYRQYIVATGKKNGNLFESDINFIRERHDLQMKLLRKNYSVSILLLCILVLLLATIIIINRIRWIRKEKRLSDEKHKVAIELAEQRQLAEQLRYAEEKKQLEIEKDNYIKMYDETLHEIEHLKNTLKDNELDSSVRKHVAERLTLLNKFVAANIVPAFSNDAVDELRRLMTDKRHFVESTGLSFGLAYPEFIKYLHKHGLTDSEVGFCCFYTIGLRGKDIANYMGMSQSGYYKFSSNLRKKFALEEKDTNIDIFLRNLFCKTTK